MKIFKIVCALIFAFLFCLSCSIYFKTNFQIEGDYLSAFSTLVAAIVAYYFYSDWKEEHKFKLLEQYQSFLKEKSSILFNNFKNAHLKFATIEGSRVEDGKRKFDEGIISFATFIDELSKTQRILIEYKSCLSTLEKNKILEIHVAKLDNYNKALGNIVGEYVNLFPLYRDISSVNKYLNILENSKECIREFDFFCSVELSDFYFKILELK
ncbi:hypothetical protein OHV84_15905 [Acinetobacter baumannii]|nr:hypothetical protein [Acinetobacter baumannii]MDC4886682.1 hypothetical protein [Acinetobacter baumannii]MDC4925445.1 hypothetical protein [Acinetobacter baumannii]MDC4940356.1 hypothetical protein [Acinetobacter baumannii]MDC5001736.1 hypothetical protein [Acinetobacter baumannii]